MEHHGSSPLRFIYDMDDEIERRQAFCKAPSSGSVPSSNDVSIKKTTKDLHGSSPSSLSFDESVSTVPSYEDWSSHHSFTEQHGDLDDDDDEDYFGDGEKEDDHDQHLQSNHRHPRTPTKNKDNFCYASPGPTTTTSSSSSSPCGKKSKSKSKRTRTNSKPKLKLRLKSRLISGLISPKKTGCTTNNKKKEKNTTGMTDWQKELGLPVGTTEEEAIAVLLTRELSALEL
mmetsp:Transcript_46426/g.113124  ORF Transcript_46426/g.113124 Transcript_46426/m.113124 type:complete len:229 (+) Transcript_46426:36-722(+)